MARKPTVNQENSRRSFLRKTGAAGALGIAGLAGCTGDGDNSSGGGSGGDGSGGGDSEQTEESTNWPPSSGTIDWTVWSTPGSGSHTYTQLYSEHARNHVEDGDQLTSNVSAVTSGGGIANGNRLANAEPDGSYIGYQASSYLTIQAIANADNVEWDPATLRYLAQGRSKHRGLFIRKDLVDGHWDWSWDKFVEEAYDLNWGLAGETHGSTVLATLMGKLIDDFDYERLSDQFVQFEGSSRVRAAIERDEIDLYFGSFETNYFPPRSDIVKTLFVATDPRLEEFNNRMREVDSNAKTFGSDTSISQDAVETMVDMTVEREVFTLPSETPDDIYNIWLDAFNAAYEDDALLSDVEDAFGNLTVSHSPLSGQELQDAMIEMWENRQAQSDLIENIFGN